MGESGNDGALGKKGTQTFIFRPSLIKHSGEVSKVFGEQIPFAIGAPLGGDSSASWGWVQSHPTWKACPPCFSRPKSRERCDRPQDWRQKNACPPNKDPTSPEASAQWAGGEPKSLTGGGWGGLLFPRLAFSWGTQQDSSKVLNNNSGLLLKMGDGWGPPAKNGCY